MGIKKSSEEEEGEEGKKPILVVIFRAKIGEDEEFPHSFSLF